jgi:hypothetical protein
MAQQNNSFGFIMTRYVNSVITNKYWNQSVKLIRTIYPLKQIIIIDDNSNQDFVKSEHNYENITIIQSQYPQRGELLGYIYFLQYKWFNAAIIIHDSLFIHKRINFTKFNLPVLPLWHHQYDKENINNILRLSSVLKNNKNLVKKLTKNEDMYSFSFSNINFDLCFGCQCYIKLNFLEMLERKYKISNLVNVVRNRTDRCSLERIMGVLFCQEYPKLLLIKSLFGKILQYPKAYSYSYEEYCNDIKNKKKIPVFTKVWTGR